VKGTMGGGGGGREWPGNEMLCFFHLWREISRSPSGSLFILLIYIPTLQACGWGHPLIIFSCRSISLSFVYILTRCRIRIRIRISLATINHAMQCPSLSLSLSLSEKEVWLVRGAMGMAPSLHCNCHCGGQAVQAYSYTATEQW